MSVSAGKLETALAGLEAFAAAAGLNDLEAVAAVARSAVAAAPGRTAAQRRKFLQDLCGPIPDHRNMLTALANLLVLFEQSKAAGLTQDLVAILALADAAPDLAERAVAAARAPTTGRRRKGMKRASQTDIDGWTARWREVRMDEDAFWSLHAEFKNGGLAAADQTAVIAALTGVDKSRLTNKDRRLEELERWRAQAVRDARRAEERATATSRF